MLCKWRWALLIGLAWLAARAQTSSPAERRLALVIGNSAYSAKGHPLKNPVNDARAMERTLRELGFEVITELNANYAVMGQSIERFARRLGQGSVGLFYYAGHGVQIENINYLLPVDYDERGLDEWSLKRSSIAVDDVVRPMEKSGARLSLVILDACRDNPYLAGRGRSVSRGLAFMEPARGSAIMFAAKAGQQAEDNPAEQNGIFTKHLVDALREPGLSLVDVAERVKERVFEATGRQQQPSFYNETIGRFVFRPGEREQPSQAAAAPEAPSIANVTADRLEVEPDQSVALTVAASDPNADPLQYSWATTAGRVEGRGTAAVFSPGAAGNLSGASSVTVTVTARNSRGLEARKDIQIRLKPRSSATPANTIARAIALGPILEIWLESRSAEGAGGLVEANLERIENVWQVTRVDGTFSGAPVSVTGECRNCTLLGVLESPSPANGFLRARVRVQPLNTQQAIGVRLHYQAASSAKRKR